MRFGNHGGLEKTACCEEDNRNRTKKEIIDDIKNSIKYQKSRLKQFEKEMDALKILKQSYNYNCEQINTMVGICFIEIDSSKGSIESQKERLKKVDKKDAN